MPAEDDLTAIVEIERLINEAVREARLRELASRLFFKLETRGARFALYRDVDVSQPVRHVLNTWKLRGPHGG